MLNSNLQILAFQVCSKCVYYTSVFTIVCFTWNTLHCISQRSILSHMACATFRAKRKWCGNHTHLAQPVIVPVSFGAYPTFLKYIIPQKVMHDYFHHHSASENEVQVFHSEIMVGIQCCAVPCWMGIAQFAGVFLIQELHGQPWFKEHGRNDRRLTAEAKAVCFLPWFPRRTLKPHFNCDSPLMKRITRNFWLRRVCRQDLGALNAFVYPLSFSNIMLPSSPAG